MRLYLFFDSLLSNYPKEMETEKWPNAADSPLQPQTRIYGRNFFLNINYYKSQTHLQTLSILVTIFYTQIFHSNFECGFVTSDLRTTRVLIGIKPELVFFQIFRNQRPQNHPSTDWYQSRVSFFPNFYPDRVNFCILVGHFIFENLSWRVVTSDHEKAQY